MGAREGGGFSRILVSTSAELAICYLGQLLAFEIPRLIGQVFHTWGTHLGATKDPASILRSPVIASRCISSIFVFRVIVAFSFCSPSLGPTSTIRTTSSLPVLAVDKLLLQLRFKMSL